MTNEQTIVLLRLIQRLLREARNEVKDDLPEEMVLKEKVFGFARESAPVLMPIERVENCIRHQISTLQGKEK